MYNAEFYEHNIRHPCFVIHLSLPKHNSNDRPSCHAKLRSWLRVIIIKSRMVLILKIDTPNINMCQIGYVLDSMISLNVLYTITFTCITHWGRDKMDAISQKTFSCAISWMKMYEFRLKFHLECFPKGPINNIPSLVQIMVWRRPGDKPLSEAMMVDLPTHVCVTRPQWVKKTCQD